MRQTQFYLLLLIVSIAPLSLGAVGAPAWGALAVSVGILMAAWGLTATLSGTGEPALDLARCWSFVLPLTLVIAWSLAQGLSSLSAEWQHPLWHAAAAALGAPTTGNVTLDPFEAGSALARLLLCAGVFWLSLQACRDSGRARLALGVLSGAGLLYAAYGLIAHLSGAEMVLWFEKTSYRQSLTSTFVNRNSYATYAGLGLVVTTGLLFELLGTGFAVPRGPRARLHELLTNLAERGWLLILVWVVIASALLLTQSRAGLIAALAGISALLTAFGLRRGARPGLPIAVAIGILGSGIGLYAISGEQTGSRLAAAGSDLAERGHLYDLTLEAIAERPLLGSGYGSFPDVFRQVRDAQVPQDVVMAHNSYFEIALELGVPAAALLVLALAAIFLRCAIGARVRRRDSVYPCIGVGATVLVAVHSAVDFSLQVPAVAATYALVMGLAVAQSWPSTPPAQGRQLPGPHVQTPDPFL